MKTLGVLFLFLVVSLTCVIAVDGQDDHGPGCSGGKRSDGVFYTDCWDNATDDKDRLRSAVYLARGSKLVFNEASYSVSDAITVEGHTILEGFSPAGDGVSKTLITLTGTSKSIFIIGPGTRGVTIRDLGLEASSLSGTIGISATAATGQSSSQMSQFNNLWFKGFAIGVKVLSTGADDGWQFDDAHLSDATFENCGTAIYINAIGGMQINNINIASTTDQNGIDIESGGYISMNMVVGNASKTGVSPVANEFIRIKKHGVISIQNTSGEWYKKQLIIDDGGTEKSWVPIYLINNGFPDCPYPAGQLNQTQTVEIRNSVVISTGNDYACTDKDAPSFTGDTSIITAGPSRPKILGTSDVISLGDRFCKWTSRWCDPYSETRYGSAISYPRSEFSVEGAVSTLNTSNITNVDDYSSPILGITSSFEGKALLELGNSSFFGNAVHKYKYSFSRASDSWLEIEGNLDPPYAGYRFKKGPVQLAGSTLSGLSSHSTAPAGSMLYCSDCTAPSTPCSGSGGGALALRVGSSAWHCK